MMDPPMFTSEQDLLVWRKKVAAFVDFVTTAASKDPDRTYKSIAATLAVHLYERGLPQAQKSIVDEAQALGKIDYKQDDQFKAVQAIVNLIPVEPPIAVVTRLIDSFNNVTSCKKRANESLNMFLSRYRGHAAEHLMRVGATTSSQVGEVLAITLLQNANLPESTLTNAKINLTQLAETRKRDEEETPFQVAAKTVSSLIESGKELDEMENSLECGVSSKGEGPADVLISTLPVIASVNKKLKDPLKELNQASSLRKKEKITRSITTTGPRCVLSLDDAVTVLRSLAQTVAKVDDRSKDSSKTSAADEIQKTVKDQLRSFYSSDFFGRGFEGSNQSKKGKNTQENSNRKRGWKSPESELNLRPSKRQNKNDRGRKPPIIENDVCKDCGSTKHLRGSSECENLSFFTMKLAEAKNDQARNQGQRSKDQNQENVNFRLRKHSKNKGA